MVNENGGYRSTAVINKNLLLNLVEFYQIIIILSNYQNIAGLFTLIHALQISSIFIGALQISFAFI
jgi:hypothetical protein